MNLNTILNFVVIAVLAWFGHTTSVNNEALIELRTSARFMRSDVDDIKHTLTDGVISKREFDFRMLDVGSRLVSCETRLTEIERKLKTP